MNAPVVIHDSSDLVATVERAMRLLDEGDLIAARELARRAYDDAAGAVALARRMGAARELVGKANRLQADALLIRTRAEIAIAEEVDAAQAAGLMSTGGRPGRETVEDGNGFTAASIGLDRKEIMEARRLRDAVAAEPGIVERAIAARVAAGVAPTRASLRAAIGTKTASEEERGLNLYETPEDGTRAILAVERFSPFVWEPACGRGAIARMLEAHGHHVLLSDIEDRGVADRHGELQRVDDFLDTGPDYWAGETMAAGPGGRVDIVTNPPYGEKIVDRFIRHALEVHRPAKMAMLLNLNWLAGCEDEDRLWVRRFAPPARVWVLTRRLPMMHRDGWDGPKASSSMNTMWVVWERDALTGGYGQPGDTRLLSLDWKHPGEACGDAVADTAAGLTQAAASRPHRRREAAGVSEKNTTLDAAALALCRELVAARKRPDLGPSWLARVAGLTRAQAEAALELMEGDGLVTAKDAAGLRKRVELPAALAGDVPASEERAGPGRPAPAQARPQGAAVSEGDQS